jgi:hypothetical protein
LILTLDNAFSQFVHHPDFDSSKRGSSNGAWEFVLVLHLVRALFFLWVGSWVATAGAPLCSIPDHLSLLITVFFFMFIALFIIALVCYLMTLLSINMESPILVNQGDSSIALSTVPAPCF